MEKKENYERKLEELEHGHKKFMYALAILIGLEVVMLLLISMVPTYNFDLIAYFGIALAIIVPFFFCILFALDGLTR